MSHDRRGAIGGSDVGAILGISKWQTAADVWDKIMGIARPPQDERSHQIRGTYLEAHIARLYSYMTGRPVHRVDVQYHEKFKFLRAATDFVFEYESKRGPLEIKSQGPWVFKDTRDNGVAPDYYAQNQHYQFVGDYPMGAFAIMSSDAAWILMLPESEWDKPTIREIIDQSFIFPDVPRDEEWLGKVVPHLCQWWERHVVGNIRPVVEQENGRRDLIWPAARIGAEAVDWSGNEEFNLAVERLRIAKQEFGLAETAKKHWESKVKEMMGDNPIVLSRHGRMSFKEETRRDLNTERLAAEHPDINLDNYKDPSVTRVFRPKFT